MQKLLLSTVTLLVVPAVSIAAPLIRLPVFVFWVSATALRVPALIQLRVAVVVMMKILILTPAINV